MIRVFLVSFFQRLNMGIEMNIIKLHINFITYDLFQYSLMKIKSLLISRLQRRAVFYDASFHF